MDDDNVQFLAFLIGKRIKLTLNNASYFGVVQRINPNKTIVLADVVSVTDGCRYAGTKLFFGHDIINVEFPKEEEEEEERRSIPENKFEDHLPVEKFQPYRRTIRHDEEDEDGEYMNFVVIDKFSEKFGPAVMDIKKQQVIGLAADGVETYKHGRLCWLQIATKNKVYLFDILVLGVSAFRNGLSMILKSTSILKVIHDCRAISGYLVAHFGVELINVFDTQVADVMCFYSKTGGFLPDRVSTLSEVITLHLKVPSSQLVSLQMKFQLTKEEKEMWYNRPCPLPMLKVMALSVIHLLPLRLALLDTLMTDYLILVDSYLRSSHYQPDELEHLSMDSVLGLPKELRQLEQMHSDRRKWAAECFPVTEQGLLDRFNPRKSGTSAEREEWGQEVENPSQPDSEYIGASSVQSVGAHASLSVGRGHTESLMETNGRGKPCGKEQPSFQLLPGIGRGRLLQMPLAQIPGGSARKITHTALSHSDSGCFEYQTSSTKEADVTPQSLRQSFKSFKD